MRRAANANRRRRKPWTGRAPLWYNSRKGKWSAGFGRRGEPGGTAVKVVDLRNIFTSCNDELIEITDTLIYYAEEKMEEGHPSLFLLEYNRVTKRERVIANYLLPRPGVRGALFQLSGRNRRRHGVRRERSMGDAGGQALRRGKGHGKPQLYRRLPEMPRAGRNTCSVLHRPERKTRAAVPRIHKADRVLPRGFPL